MNLMTKKTPWVAACLIIAASVFGQQSRANNNNNRKTFDQGHEANKMQMMAAYNAPARIDVRGAWDFFASASFTYWQPIQDNMELAAMNNTLVVAPFTTNVANADVVHMKFGYKPGFKVGLGMNFDLDNWDSFLEYTWFRGTNSQSTRTNGISRNIQPMMGAGIVAQNMPLINIASGKWKLHMDFLDLDLARSYYVGTNLTFRPFFGTRAAWIRQRSTASYTNTLNSANETMSSTQQSYSWGIGPMAGLNANFILGEGFRIYGKGKGDILFTQYTGLTSETTSWDVPTRAGTFQRYRDKNVSTLRTHLELELGIGWGTYFDNNNWHVDLAAGYGFQVFFDQNMFRWNPQTVAALAAMSRLPNGNLYVQGLTASARFDF